MTPRPASPPAARRLWLRVRVWIPGWLTDWRALRSMVTAQWYSPAAAELRAAYHDTRRAPGCVVLGMIAVFWPMSDWSWFPLIVAGAAWGVLLFVTRPLRWRIRRRVRRFCRPGIGLLALFVLAEEAGVWAWILAVGLWLIVAALTDTVRARRRLQAWLIGAVARNLRADPEEFQVERSEWDEQEERRLTFAEVTFGPDVRTEDAGSRERVTQAVAWSMRHAGKYSVSWPPGRAAFEITAAPALPPSVYEQNWGPDLPGIPIGVTDPDTADGVVDTVDAHTGEVLSSHPVALVNPADTQKHYLVIGGTGAGKSVWMRGFIARALRLGWFPGGMFIVDGKGGSDYIVFEGRDGIHCVARHPAEWSEWLPRVSAMMRQRYDEDAEYHRGHRDKPAFPRYLVVLDEVQEIRSTLGKADLDPILQQISRQMRASNGRLMVSTQRPDAEDAIPGAVKDMLEDRIILGFISATGARMVLDNDWRTVVDEYGTETVPGRGMARIGGRLLRIQGFNLDTPREHPEVEGLYPRMLDADDQEPATQAELPANVIRWAPRPTPPAAEEPAATGPATKDQTDSAADEADRADTSTPQGAAEVEPAPEPPPPPPAPATPEPGPAQTPPRRRRTV